MTDVLTLAEREQWLDRSINTMWRAGVADPHGVQAAYLVNWFLQALEIDTELASRWES